MRVAVTLCLVFLLAAGALAQVELGDDPISQAAIQIAEKLAAAAEPKSGEVVDEDTTDMQHPTLYVMLGSKDGVGEGTMLDIIEKGAPIKVGEEVIGFRENPAGTAKIVRVQSEKLSVARVETIVPGESPGKDCIAYVKTVPQTLAMCAFQNSDKAVSKLGLEFADKVGAALSGTGKFTVIERPQLEELLGGPKANTADLLNPEKSGALAPKVPAKALVTGTIAKQNDRYVIAVRVLEIGAGIPLGATTATIARSDEADGKYADVKDGTGGGGGTVTPPLGTSVKLFDEVKPFEQSISRSPLGKCSVAGQVFDDCYGYTPERAEAGGGMGPGPLGLVRVQTRFGLMDCPRVAFAVFDLKGLKWKAMKASMGQHPTDPRWRLGSLMVLVSTDGREAARLDPQSDWAECEVPLDGVRTLRIDVADVGAMGPGGSPQQGFIVAGDFQLIAGE